MGMMSNLRSALADLMSDRTLESEVKSYHMVAEFTLPEPVSIDDYIEMSDIAQENLTSLTMDKKNQSGVLSIVCDCFDDETAFAHATDVIKKVFSKTKGQFQVVLTASIYE